MHKHIVSTVLALSCMGVSLLGYAHSENAVKWSYEASTGPGHWGGLNSEYALCSSGQAQSPVNIVETMKTNLAALNFKYQPSAAQVLNNGHTIQVSPVAGGGLELATGYYSLLQMHFHTPSEEQISGITYPLSAHFVHRNDSGELAVVAVLFREGEHNEALQPILGAMPVKVGKVSPLAAQDFRELLPDTRHYFAYQGSLTTPPCSEGVRWHVLTEPVELSSVQLQMFKVLYPMNARPVQPLNGRVVQIDG